MPRSSVRASLSILLATATSIPATARADEPEARPGTPDTCTGPAAVEPRGPATAARLLGRVRGFAPYARKTFGSRCMRLELPLSVAGRLEGVSSFPLDRAGTTLGGRTSVSPELRLGARFSSGMEWAPAVLLAEGELDLLTGVTASDPPVLAPGVPGSEGVGAQLRKLHARASLGRLLHIDLGAQTSHWGMGLLANDGAHGWEPGSASFVDPRRGDRVLRAQLATGPHTPAKAVLSIGADHVLGDDIMLEGDSAQQMFLAVLAGVGEPLSAGAYVVRRHQTDAAGRSTDVTAIDATAKASVDIPGGVVGIETEWALFRGTTELGATVEHRTHDLLALGGAARASLDLGAFGTVLDFLYASGDQNAHDGAQNTFQADPNYPFGLLLFRQVMAAQSARSAGLAGDPLLVGTPVSGVERLPTRGSVANTLALFPRLRYRPAAGLEVYGGPLFAFANVPLVDAFETQIAGGASRSSLGGSAGRNLGTELDVGVRYRAILHGAELTMGAEGGALAPGSAFRTIEGTRMDAVYGARGLVRYRF